MKTVSSWIKLYNCALFLTDTTMHENSTNDYH